MIKVDVAPGICGFPTKMIIKQAGGLRVQVEVESACRYIDDLSAELNDIDAYQECFKTGDHSKILELAMKRCQHFSCPVPIALIKGIEAVLGVQKAQDVHIHFSEENDSDDNKITG